MNDNLKKYSFLAASLLLLAPLSAAAAEGQGAGASLEVQQAKKTVTGTVLDEKGEPIIGANVVQKGVNNVGTITDIDGKFSISVPQNANLVISYIGYRSQTVPAQSGLTYQLKLDATNLDEVVVVAYGTAKKKDLTGSMSQVDTKAIAVQSAGTVSKALEGSAPGLRVTSADGQPGQDMGIRIRGVSSANGASSIALIVIDGVPAQGDNPLANLNSQDIASVTVLKDAASTALYGSRGANGVVLITTKGGQSGKTKVSFNGRWGWNSVGPFNMSNMTDPADYYEYQWKSIYNSYRYGVDGKGRPGVDANGFPYTNVKNPNHSHEEAAQFASAHLFNYNTGTADSETNWSRNGMGNWMAYQVPGAIYTPDNGKDADRSATMSGAYLVNPDGRLNPAARLIYGDGEAYADELLNAEFRQEYNVSAQGGTDKMHYFASLGYLADPSYVRNSNFRRYSGRMNVDAQLFPWLKVGTNVGYVHTSTNAMSTKWGRNPGSATGNVMVGVNGTAPIVGVWAYDKDGKPVYNADGTRKEAGYEDGTYSPLGVTSGNAFGRDLLYEIDNNVNKTTVDLWTSRVFAEISFLNDFKFLVNFSMDHQMYRLLKYRNSKTGLGKDAGGVGINKSTTRMINTQQLLTYNKDIKLHHVDAMVGHEYDDYDTDQLNWGSSYELIPGYISPGNFTSRYTGVQTLATPGWSLNKRRMESYLGRVNYVYDDKYYVSGSVRADGSSKFFKNKWGTFWSVGGGWRITSEKFMEGTKSWLENAKLRASYGVIGNQNGIGNYTNHTWSYGVAAWNTSTNGTNTAKTYSIGYGGLINEELTWENTHTFDVGLDFALLGGRIAGTFDFYNSLTTNSFYNQPVSYLANAGAETRQRNCAKLRNRGIEIELNADIIRTKDWTWNVGINGTHYTTVLTEVPATAIPEWTEKSDQPKGTWTATGEGWSAAGTGNTSGTFYLRGEGRDWYNLYLYKYAGVNQEYGLPEYWHRVTWGDVNPGADGSYEHGGRYKSHKQGENVRTTVSNDASLYECGSAIPAWIGGLTSTLRYKDFDLQLVAAYQFGGKFFSTEYANGLYLGSSLGDGNEPLSTDLIGNTWTPENTGAEFPMQWSYGATHSYYDGSTLGSWKYTDMSLFSASYFRMKNITLGYTLPKNLTRKAMISSLRVYVSADNLFYISAKKGVDPSMSLMGGNEVGQYVYPTMRTLSLGINLEF